MVHFIVYDPNDPNGESYWVLADTAEGARQIVASNVIEAKEAANPKKFDCKQDSKKQPPRDVIYCRLHGPVMIKV